MAGDCSSSSSSPLHSIQVETLSSDLYVGTMVQAQKCGLRSGPAAAGSISPVSPVQSSKSMLSRSSLFCNNLYRSSPTSSEAHRPLGNLPFRPHIPTYNKSISNADSTNSSSLFSDDMGHQGDDRDSEEVLVKDFLSLPGDSSDGSFHGPNCTDDNSVLAEQFELQYLSDELDVVMIDNGENPKLDVSMLLYCFNCSQNKKTFYNHYFC